MKIGAAVTVFMAVIGLTSGWRNRNVPVTRKLDFLMTVHCVGMGA